MVKVIFMLCYQRKQATKYKLIIMKRLNKNKMNLKNKINRLKDKF